jgi:hypothetical protein
MEEPVKERRFSDIGPPREDYQRKPVIFLRFCHKFQKTLKIHLKFRSFVEPSVRRLKA